MTAKRIYKLDGSTRMLPPVTFHVRRIHVYSFLRRLAWSSLLAICSSLFFLDCARADDDVLARTPPMGWNSWNKFACNVSEQLIRDTADAMVSSGMQAAGYEYVVID